MENMNAAEYQCTPSSSKSTEADIHIPSPLSSNGGPTIETFSMTEGDENGNVSVEPEAAKEERWGPRNVGAKTLAQMYSKGFINF